MSYLQGLKLHLAQEELLNEDLVDALDSYDKLYRAQQNSKNNIFTWGRYKGKKIEDIFKIDRGYCEWMIKQEYCSRVHKEYIEKLLRD